MDYAVNGGEMQEWLLPKVTEWAETIKTLGRFSVRYLHTAYTVFLMSLQVE